MRNDYPILPPNPTMDDVAKWLNKISQLRSVEDLSDYNNQKNIYVSGRSTTRVPTSNSDVLATDRQGDVCYAVDASYVYILVSASGTLKWARIALNVAW